MSNVWSYQAWFDEYKDSWIKEIKDIPSLKGAEIKISGDASANLLGSSFIIQITLKDIGTDQISFILEPYTACCAMYQVNQLRIASGLLTEEQFNNILDTTFRFLSTRFSARCKQIILQIPEGQTFDHYKLYGQDQYLITKHKTILERMYRHYRYWYKWAKTHMNHEMMFTNPNTGNIIHTIVVKTDLSNPIKEQ